MNRPNRDARTLRAVARDLAKRARGWRATAYDADGLAWSAYNIRASECEYLADHYRAQARELERSK